MVLWGKERYKQAYFKPSKEYKNRMEEYLTSMCFCGSPKEFLKDLEEFSKGFGVMHADYMIVFAFNSEDIPEMEEHEGVGFFWEWDEPEFFTYEEFCSELKKVTEDYFSDEDERYQMRARKLLRSIKFRCGLKWTEEEYKSSLADDRFSYHNHCARRHKKELNMLEDYVCQMAWSSNPEFYLHWMSLLLSGVGVQQSNMMIVFDDDGDCIRAEEYPEFIGFKGVLIEDDIQKPELYTYEEFYRELEDVTKDYFFDKDDEYAAQAEKLLDKFREKYEIK